MFLRIGSKNEYVFAVQQRLLQLGHYGGNVDSRYGGETEAAVRRFQEANRLPADGCVGPQTWSTLFPISGDIVHRCLALTGSFETSNPVPSCFGAVAGDFDGQGLSAGALQWNIGQGTLQPLLAEMDARHRSVYDRVFGENAATLRSVTRMPLNRQLSWARSIQDGQGSVAEPWKGAFHALGYTVEFQRIQTRAARALYVRAVQMAFEYGLFTQRGIALMFDIAVQNGSISSVTKSRILQDAAFTSPRDGQPREVARMRAIALHRAAAALPAFVSDVRARKLTIAEGTGTVHGIRYDLETQFGIRLEPPDRLVAA